jgi:hypothetical protein
VPHGGWLPWLRDNCSMSERTAQLYMRVAKNRAEIEGQMRNGIADLSLNEAAALLMMTSDIRKLIAFVKDCEHLHGEELVERCIAEGVGLIRDDSYDPFLGRSEAEKLEWHLFTLLLSYDSAAGRGGMEPQCAWMHVDYVLQKGFQNVAEWLGEEGEKWRRKCGIRPPSQEFKADWAAFLAKNRERALADVVSEFDALGERFDQEKAEGRLPAPPSKRKRRGLRRAAP